MKKSQKISQKIVVKVGSSILTGGGTSIVPKNLSRIARHIANLSKDDKNIILVSSGAIASGLSVLGFKKRPSELSELQAVAAVGQNILMHAYSIEFKKHNLKCAQILLTKDDFGQQRKKYLCNTIHTLFKHKIIPIVNENDSVSVDEIKIGDNDTLSAYVAAAIKADGLLILTDIDGLYRDFDARDERRGNIVKEVTFIDSKIEKMACGTDKASCVGGMSTKIKAARIATHDGIPVILANGLQDVLRIDFTSPSYARFDGTRFVVVGAKK